MHEMNDVLNYKLLLTVDLGQYIMVKARMVN